MLGRNSEINEISRNGQFMDQIFVSNDGVDQDSKNIETVVKNIEM